jgi:hypothetical protein
MDKHVLAQFFTDNGGVNICPVCAVRWGGPVFGEREVEIARCEKHQKTLSTAEIYAKGMSVGEYRRSRYFLEDLTVIRERRESK